MQETWVWSLGQERPPGGGNVLYLQHSCLGNPMDGGAWWAAVHGVAKSWTRLSYFPFTFHFHALEKEMATHSSVLAWRIPGTGEPGGLLSMGSHRVGHDWSDLAAAAAAEWTLNPIWLVSLKKKISCLWKHLGTGECHEKDEERNRAMVLQYHRLPANHHK